MREFTREWPDDEFLQRVLSGVDGVVLSVELSTEAVLELRPQRRQSFDAIPDFIYDFEVVRTGAAKGRELVWLPNDESCEDLTTLRPRTVLVKPVCCDNGPYPYVACLGHVYVAQAVPSWIEAMVERASDTPGPLTFTVGVPEGSSHTPASVRLTCVVRNDSTDEQTFRWPAPGESTSGLLMARLWQNDDLLTENDAYPDGWWAAGAAESHKALDGQPVRLGPGQESAHEIELMSILADCPALPLTLWEYRVQLRSDAGLSNVLKLEIDR